MFQPILGKIIFPLNMSPAGEQADRVRLDPEMQRTAERFVRLMAQAIGRDYSPDAADDIMAHYDARTVAEPFEHEEYDAIDELITTLASEGWWPLDSNRYIDCRMVSPALLAKYEQRYRPTTPVAAPAPAITPPQQKETPMLKYEDLTPDQMARARRSGAIDETAFKAMRADWQSRGAPRVPAKETVPTPLPASAPLFGGKAYEAFTTDEMGRMRESGAIDKNTYAAMRADWIERGKPPLKTTTAA